ncbi:MAG: heparinase II/III family protein [Polyangiaceae bacterium]
MLRRSLGSLALGAALAVSPSCKRCGAPVRLGQEERPPPVELPEPKLPPAGREPAAIRLLLDAPAQARLRRAAESRDAAFVRVEARCDEALQKPIDSGYQGFDWADALANLSLCYRATRDAKYASGAVRYLRALTDDRFRVGDGRGGSDVVRHDSGYGIRTFGVYSALGYDWLRDARELDEGLRAHVLVRLGEWIDWYAESGYLRQHPFANYYWGYLTTLSFAGLAAAGESKAADTWLARARLELTENVLPRFRAQLTGGGFPEGWQYGEYTTAEIALTAHAFRTGAGIDVAAALPWLADLVPHHMHALLPDEGSVYDGGTWGEHPAAPSGLALSAVSVAIEHRDPRVAGQARWLAENVLPKLVREQAWIGLLANRPGEPGEDPRRGAATSCHLPGQGLSFARGDWSKTATWVSFQAGPFLAEDHQDADQGHFELWRGSDALLVDAGDAEGAATINHNTVLVDDGGRHMNYPPNQGVWGRDVRTLRFADDGVVVLALGDLTGAYLPTCATEGCRARSVEKLLRTFVFARPSLVVVDDRIELERADFATTFALHVIEMPNVSGSGVSARRGRSRVDLEVLEPAAPEIGVVDEPSPSRSGPHEKSSTWAKLHRIEVRSPRGLARRGFSVFARAVEHDAPARGVERVQGRGLRGGVAWNGAERVAVLFAESANARAELPSDTTTVVLVGLEPGRSHRAEWKRDTDCALSLELGPGEPGTAANAGGFIRFAVPTCPKPP